MVRSLFGMETEYALVAGPGNQPRINTAERLMALARRRLPHLRGACSSGLFLQNRGRFYIGAGIGAYPRKDAGRPRHPRRP